MCQFFTSHFDKLSDPNNFGSTNNRSTTHALIKLADLIFKSAASPDTIIRILFVDFAKAFDLVNHNVLLRKFQAYDFPPHITAWFYMNVNSLLKCEIINLQLLSFTSWCSARYSLWPLSF
jgi:hypothetical protein